MANRREDPRGEKPRREEPSSSRPVTDDDIRARLTPTGRPRMALTDRARIFIPFEPLRGFAEALREREEAIDDEFRPDWERPGHDAETDATRPQD